MSTFARYLSARMFKLCLRPLQKNQLLGLGLARHSTAVPGFGNFEAREKHAGSPFPKSGFLTLVAFGGLGLSLVQEREYQAKCAENEALKDLKSKLTESTEAALKEYTQLSAIFKNIMKIIDLFKFTICDDKFTIVNATDEPINYQELRCAIIDLASKMLSFTLPKGQTTRELLCKLREVVKNGKNPTYNPRLILAENSILTGTNDEVLNQNDLMDYMERDLQMLDEMLDVLFEFTDLEEARRELKTDLEDVAKYKGLPDPDKESEMIFVIFCTTIVLWIAQNELGRRHSNFLLGMSHICSLYEK